MELGMKRLCCYCGRKNYTDQEDKAGLGGTALNNPPRKIMDIQKTLNLYGKGFSGSVINKQIKIFMCT